MLTAVSLVVLVATCEPAQAAAPPPPQTAASIAQPRPKDRVVGADRDLRDLKLVKSTDDRAAVKFARGKLEQVAVGDLLGRTRARVVEIQPGRLVLDESFTGRDGRPNRARIILREGQTGGTRYVARLDEPAPLAARPEIVTPKRP